VSLLISGATIIDGVAKNPIEGQAIWIEGGRIRAIGRRDELGVPPRVQVIDARGKYVIPGLMNANVHLLLDTRMENLVRHEASYEALIAEAAQVALKGGVTTVFDTAGPRKPLMAVRDKINAGELQGSRIFCAGWIIGMDGPFSQDFFAKVPEVASGNLVTRINSLFVENVGPDLMWMTPDQVVTEIRKHIARGVDFIKFASNDHSGPFLTFSERVQAALVQEAHSAGISAQAHSMSVEGLRVAIESGCDLVQHVNITGPVPIPVATLELLTERKTGAVVFAFTQRRLDAIMRGHEGSSLWTRRAFANIDTNCRSLVQSGASILLGSDGGLLAADAATDPLLKGGWIAAGQDNLNDLGEGHLFWLKAMEEKGMAPMEMLRAATRNIAVAYGKDEDLGTLEPEKIADLLILDNNPLQSSENYRSIQMIVKGGVIVDRDALPAKPMLSGPVESLFKEDASYGRYAVGRFPPCC
jgi:imidazolonepropionase-like amidohydrolase